MDPLDAHDLDAARGRGRLKRRDATRLGPYVVALLGASVALYVTLAPSGAHEPSTVPVPTHPGAWADDPAFRAALAFRWAPIHRQDVHQDDAHGLRGAADYVTAYDFDGDTLARNNWDHAGDPRFPLAAHAYFSVVETRTHFFVVYVFFHPRDWSSTFFETEHENDAEGVLLVLRRDGSPHGALEAAITVAHRDFFAFVPDRSPFRDGEEDIDGRLTLRAFEGRLRPVTAQQAEGHGLKAWPAYDIHGDGVVYVPSLTTAETPSGPDDRHVRYRLVDVLAPSGLWARRHDRALFARYGAFAGDGSDGCGDGALGCMRNAASAPWRWDDHDDGSARGALATDPAGLVRRGYGVPPPFATTYTFNPFR